MMEGRITDRTARLRAMAAPVLLLCAVVLGGSSSGGAVANMVLLGISLVILLATIWLPSRTRFAADERWLLWIAIAFIVTGLLQVVPLPPGIWSALPGRAGIVHGFQLLQEPLPWLPVSLTPLATIGSLLPAATAFAAYFAVRMGEEHLRGLLLWSIVAAAGISILLGVAQLTGGENSGLRFYEHTIRNAPVGFFANSNHLATLLVASLPFVATLARGGSRRARMEGVPKLLALGALALFIMAGAIVAGSVAGLGLLVPALLGSLLIITPKFTSRWMLGGAAVVLAIFALVVAVAANSDLLQGFGATSLGEGNTGRPAIFATTWHAITTFFPVGSGLGSFLDIYPWFENAADVNRVYINHAHSDYLELVLELGLPGLILIVAFLAWWARRAAQILFGRNDGPLAKAAALASAIILAHSAVDYPLRTGAVLVLFSMSLALMARPAVVPSAAAKVKTKGRHLSV